MGFFSKLTADTQESVTTVHSSVGTRRAYLLQPNGLPPIEEVAYEGYGVFGGVDMFDWLARMNAGALGMDISNLTAEQIRNLGIELDVGTLLLDPRTGALLSIGPDTLIPGVQNFNGKWDDEIPEFGRSATDCVKDGSLLKRDTSAALNVRYAIKVSFDKNAIYEDLEASLDCPHQGLPLPAH